MVLKTGETLSHLANLVSIRVNLGGDALSPCSQPLVSRPRVKAQESKSWVTPPMSLDIGLD